MKRREMSALLCICGQKLVRIQSSSCALFLSKIKHENYSHNIFLFSHLCVCFSSLYLFIALLKIPNLNSNWYSVNISFENSLISDECVHLRGRTGIMRFSWILTRVRILAGALYRICCELNSHLSMKSTFWYFWRDNWL